MTSKIESKYRYVKAFSVVHGGKTVTSNACFVCWYDTTALPGMNSNRFWGEFQAQVEIISLLPSPYQDEISKLNENMIW